MIAVCSFRLHVQGLARFTELGVLHTTGSKKDQTAHRLSLRKQNLIPRIRAGASTGDNLGAFSFGEASEQRGSGHQRQMSTRIELDRREVSGGGTSVRGPGYFGR